jgi:translation initiation factor IF-2
VGGPAPATSPDITAQIRSFQEAAGRPGAAPAAGARPAPTPRRVGRQRAPGAPPGGAEPGGAERAGAAEPRGGRARSPAQPSPARRSPAGAARRGAAQPSPEARSRGRPQVSSERPARLPRPVRSGAPSLRAAEGPAGGGRVREGGRVVPLPRTPGARAQGYPVHTLCASISQTLLLTPP